jgi:glycosyltransferase involved in cell wall biosynthesis
MGTSKTIWIINQYVGSPYHGMEYRHYYLAKEFLAKGHQVQVISGSYSHLYKNMPQAKGAFTFEEVDGIPYCWIKVPEYKRSTSIGRIINMLVFMYRLFSLPLKKMQKPDMIIVSSPSLFPVVNGKRLADKFKAKLVFEVRDVWPLTLQELGNLSSRHPFIKMLQWFEDYAYKHSNYVCSVLPGAKSHMKAHGLEERKFFYAPNGISLQEVQNPEPLDDDYLNKIPKGKFLVGYVGTIGISNAMEYFIQAAALLKENENLHFLVVGSGGEKGKLEEMAKGLSNISFLAPVGKKQVQSLLKLLDVCYIGWRKEKLYSFGISANKIFDYMYSGKPVIHSVEAYNDPIKEAGCGISVEPESPEAIKEAILEMAAMDSEARDRLGEKGRNFVVANHSYNAIAEKFLQLPGVNKAMASENNN